MASSKPENIKLVTHGDYEIITPDTSKLPTMTDEFLVRENQHRPDVFKAIQSPSLVPGVRF